MSGASVAEQVAQQAEQPLPSGDVANAVADASFTPASPLRESQVQNAVAFLAHPKVRGSSVESRRTFLAEKGLTGAEIDEAFRRVPDVPTASVAVPSPGLPAVPAAQVPQKPYPVDGGGAVASTLAQLQAAQASPPPQPIRWTQVVIGLGLLGATGYMIKQLLAPRVAQWVADWRASSDAAEKARAAAEAEREKSTAAIAAAIASQTAEMHKALDGLKGAIAALEEGRAQSGAAHGDALTVKELRSELRALASALNEYGSPSKAACEGEGSSKELAEIKKLVATVAAQLAARPAPTTAAAFTGNSPGQLAHSQAASSWGSPSPSRTQKGYSDSPPASHTMHYPPVHAPNGTVSAFAAAQPNGSGLSATSEDEGSPQMEPPHPASYMEVLEMLEKGDTPPNIRSDINDAPPDPTAPPPPPRMQPRPKPWEARAPSVTAPAAAAGSWEPPANGAANGDSAAFQPAPAFPPASRAVLAPMEGNAEADSGHVDTWKPPAVPQPSMPRALPAKPTPPPAAEEPEPLDGGGGISSSSAAEAVDPGEAAVS